MQLTEPQQDRARGCLVGAGVGDALGVPYEAMPPIPELKPAMLGGGLGHYRPGEWSDDTQMLTVVGSVAATGTDLTSRTAATELAKGWIHWSAGGATDMGIQTRRVLAGARQRMRFGASAGRAIIDASAYLHETSGRTAGNGSLMRTAPVALAYLDDAEGCAAAAMAVSELTHFDPLAGQGCAIWCELIRRAVMGEDVSPIAAADEVLGEHEECAGEWGDLLDEAMRKPPAAFAHNGYVVDALQGALSAVTPMLEALHAGIVPGTVMFRDALTRAIRGGGDTDTVAAIAGALAGAIAGFEAIPEAWVNRANGWCYAPRRNGRPDHMTIGATGLALMADRIVKAS